MMVFINKNDYEKLVFFILPLALFASCSNDSSTDGDYTSGKRDEIKLNSAVMDMDTKAGLGPLNSGFTTAFPIGIYANNGAWLSGASANWTNNDEAIVSGTAPHSVTFVSGPYYYPSDGSTINFYAFAPQATELTAAGAGTSTVVRHTIDGTHDLMWANATGYKVGSAAEVPPVLNFEHKLTQLQFTFVPGTGYPTSGNKVKSLLLKAQPTTIEMAIETGDCVFIGTADMEALSLANQSAGIPILASPGTNANSPLMTDTPSSYTMDIVVQGSGGDATYSAVPITLTPTIGSAHMVTITFNSTGITATATVADRVTGSGRSASAQYSSKYYSIKHCI